MSLQVRPVDGDFESVAPWWDAVLARTAKPSPFASHAWLSSWWATYGSGAQLHLLRLEEDGRTAGGGAFYIRRRRLRGLLPVRELRLVGDRHVGSEGLDLLVERGLEGPARMALKHHLAAGGAPAWDLAHFTGLRPGAVLLGDGSPGAHSWAQQVNRCPYLILPTDRPVAPLKKDFAARVARKSRGLLLRGGHRFERCETESQIGPLLEALFFYHQKRWVERGEKGSFAASAKRAFYEKVTPLLLRAGRLELFGIWDAERPRAVLFGASAGGTLFYLQSAFDAELGSFGPGNVLMFQILRQAQERGFERFDFMKGDEAYKFQWTQQEEPLIVHRSAAPGWRGSLLMTLLRLDAAFRRPMPASAGSERVVTA